MKKTQAERNAISEIQYLESDILELEDELVECSNLNIYKELQKQLNIKQSRLADITRKL